MDQVLFQGLKVGSVGVLALKNLELMVRDVVFSANGVYSAFDILHGNIRLLDSYDGQVVLGAHNI
jgi:hypothetical protein